jgi:hypothetical protein
MDFYPQIKFGFFTQRRRVAKKKPVPQNPLRLSAFARDTIFHAETQSRKEKTCTTNPSRLGAFARDITSREAEESKRI